MNDDPPGRVVVSIYLPMDLGKVSRIMRAVNREFPGATIDQRLGSPWRIWAENDRRTSAQPTDPEAVR